MPEVLCDLFLVTSSHATNYLSDEMSSVGLYGRHRLSLDETYQPNDRYC